MEIKPSSAIPNSGANPGSGTPAPLAGSGAPTDSRQAIDLLPGRLLTAVVESSTRVAQTQAEQRQHGLFNLVLNVDGKKLEVQSREAFAPGQQLRVEVLSATALKVIALLSGPPSATPDSQAAVLPLIQQGLREALPLQQNISLLLNNLAALRQVLVQNLTIAEASQAQTQTQPSPLPAAPLRAALVQLDQLLAQLPPAEALRQPAALKQALANSGLFLEPRLARLIAQALTAKGAEPAASSGNNVNRNQAAAGAGEQPTQAGTARLRSETGAQNLARGALNTSAQSLEQLSLKQLLNQDFKAQLLQLARSLTPLASELAIRASAHGHPSATGGQSGAIALSNAAGIVAQDGGALAPNTAARDSQSAAAVLINRIVQSLNQVGLSTASGTGKAEPNQPLQLLQLPPTLYLPTSLAMMPPPAGSQRARTEQMDLALSTILRQLAASLARVQSHQFSSLASQQAGADGAPAQNWQLEIPLYQEGQFRPLQIQIEERQASEGDKQPQQEQQWQITLGFDFAVLGPFYATLSIQQSRIAATFWSERPRTLEQIGKELDVLERSLTKLGLEVQGIDCRQGTPPLRHTRLQQQLVDVRT